MELNRKTVLVADPDANIRDLLLKELTLEGIKVETVSGGVELLQKFYRIDADAVRGELQRRGLHMLVTTTPRLEGRSFGTNVMEATLLALMDKSQAEVTREDFLESIERIPLQPEIEVLN